MLQGIIQDYKAISETENKFLSLCKMLAEKYFGKKGGIPRGAGTKMFSVGRLVGIEFWRTYFDFSEKLKYKKKIDFVRKVKSVKRIY